MNFSGLQRFLAGDFKWIVIAIAMCFAIPAFKNQDYGKLIGIIIMALVVIAFAGGAEFMGIIRWLLGLIGIRI